MKNYYMALPAYARILALLIMTAFPYLPGQAQSPGGVSSGLQTWLRADAGVTGITPITAWTNQAPGGTPVLPHGTPWMADPILNTNYNYNPYIVCNSNTSSTGLTIPNGWGPNREFFYLQGYNDTNGINYKSLFFFASLIADTVPNQHLATVENVTNAIPSNGTLYGGGNAGLPTYQKAGYDDADFGTLAPAGTWQRGGSNSTYNTTFSFGKNIHSLNSLTGGSTRINTFLGGQRDPLDTTVFKAYTTDFRGWIAEIIGYTNALTVTERQKIDSYLAIKYGVGLGHNFLSTAGTNIYTVASPYTINILGLGRDDATALLQKQSHRNIDNFRIYISSLAPSNAMNTGVFLQDRSFVILGSNGQEYCATVIPSTEVPAGLTNCTLYTRIDTEWKVTKTNFSQTFNLDIILPPCANPNAVNTAHLRLLVDNDGNFGNGGTQCFYNGDGTGISFTYSNPKITINNIGNAHIPDNSTRYITIGSISSLTPLPIELDYFTAVVGDPGINLQWQTLSEQNNAGFIVEKSSDSQNWEMLGFVNGAGNSNIPVQYALTDTFPQQGINYYRLTQVDYDGAYSDAAITSLNYQGNVIDLPYPNPGNGKYYLDNASLSEAKVDIFNHLGAKVNGQLYPEGNGRWILDISDAADGIYFVHITRKESSQLFKLIKGIR